MKRRAKRMGPEGLMRPKRPRRPTAASACGPHRDSSYSPPKGALLGVWDNMAGAGHACCPHSGERPGLRHPVLLLSLPPRRGAQCWGQQNPLGHVLWPHGSGIHSEPGGMDPTSWLGYGLTGEPSSTTRTLCGSPLRDRALAVPGTSGRQPGWGVRVWGGSPPCLKLPPAACVSAGP